MTLTTKLLIFLFAVLALGSVSFIIYKQVEISNRQQAIELSVIKQKELADNITRALSEYSTKKDLENFAKDNNVNLAAIIEDLKKIDATLTIVGRTSATSVQRVENNLPSTTTNKNPSPLPNVNDKFNYLNNKQNFKLDEKFSNISVPFADVSFSAWEEKPWSVNQPARSYNLDTIVAINEENRHIIYNKLSINVEGKDYPITINKTQYLEKYPESKFNFWAPRLYFSLDAGFNAKSIAGEIVPGVNFQIMSYGQYNNSPDFSILQVGLGYGAISKNLNFTITPVAYNIAKHIPLVDNLFIGPAIGFSTNGDISVLLGLKVGL